MSRTLWISLLVLALAPLACQAQVSFETPRLKMSVAAEARWESLTLKDGGRECCRPGADDTFSWVQTAGKTHYADQVTATDAGFQVTYRDIDTVLSYEVTPADDWLLFALSAVEGTRPERVQLMMVPAAVTGQLGRRLCAAWDEETTVCLMAANTQTACGAAGGNSPVLRATTQDFPGPKVEGAAAALILCPTDEFKAIARKLSHQFGLLTNEDADGTPVKDTELVRGSYFFLSFGEKDVDTAIEYCRQAGIKQIMMSSGAWCKSVGHYLFNEGAYPNGIDGLKMVVNKLHENGILVGMHTFVSKISKIDPYVTPVPDKRFWNKFTTELAQDVTADQTEIKVQAALNLKEWAGSPETRTMYWEGGVAKHREVVIGDEIIQYESVGPEGVWDTFYGCTRGAWGTTAATHRAGDSGVHFGVDGCINGYIIDQETDLMDEVATRIAGIFDYCDFDMVYFDGGEDVDRRRYSYYVSNFQKQAMTRFSKRPIIHMGTAMTHRLWHSFARSSTVDTYLNTLGGAIVGGRGPETWPTVRDHIDKSVNYMRSVGADMMPGELGWFGIWPSGVRGYTKELTDKELAEFAEEGLEEGQVACTQTECARMLYELQPGKKMKVSVEFDGLQLDELEYLMCKSLAYDAAVSLQTSFGQMSAHPLTPEILRIFRAYEAMRMAREVDVETRERLKQLKRDFTLIQNGAERTFVEVEPVEPIGEKRQCRATVGAFEGGSLANVWMVARDGTLTIDLDPEGVKLTGFDGEPMMFEVDPGRIVVPLDATRRTLICPNTPAEELREALAEAKMEARPATTVWVRADEATKLEGEMALGSDAGVDEPEAISGNTLVCTGAPSYAKLNHWYAEYTVDIPHDGQWTLWARVRYPTGTDMSFGLVRPGEEVTLSYTQVLGNCGVNEKKWHWTGRGGGSTSVPPGVPINLTLDEGPFTFRIYGREGGGNAANNPRLDLLCLTDDALAFPTDEQAQKAMEE